LWWCSQIDCRVKTFCVTVAVVDRCFARSCSKL